MKTEAENKRRMIEKRENIPDDDNECKRLALAGVYDMLMENLSL